MLGGNEERIQDSGSSFTVDKPPVQGWIQPVGFGGGAHTDREKGLERWRQRPKELNCFSEYIKRYLANGEKLLEMYLHDGNILPK